MTSIDQTKEVCPLFVDGFKAGVRFIATWTHPIGWDRFCVIYICCNLCFVWLPNCKMESLYVAIIWHDSLKKRMFTYICSVLVHSVWSFRVQCAGCMERAEKSSRKISIVISCQIIENTTLLCTKWIRTQKLFCHCLIAAGATVASGSRVQRVGENPRKTPPEKR